MTFAKSCVLILCLLALYVNNIAARPAIFNVVGGDGPFVKTFPSEINDPSQPLLLRWGGIELPDPTDVLYIKMAPATATSPLKDVDLPKTIGFFKVNEIDNWKAGSGEVYAPLFHPRDNAFFFEYYTNKTGVMKFIAGSAAVRATVESAASQIHLALTHNPSEMRVSYTTTADVDIGQFVQFSPESFAKLAATYRFNAAYHHDDTPSVHVALSPEDELWHDVGITTLRNGKKVAVIRQTPAIHDSTYTIKDMKHAPANKTNVFVNPGNFREAVLTDLPPASKWYYRVVDVKGNPISREFSFMSSPGVGKNITSDVFAFGDLGIGTPYYNAEDMQPPATETVNNIYKMLQKRKAEGSERPSMVLHLGDISYARGRMYMWEVYMQQIEKVVSQVPYMVTIGNHEYDYPGQSWEPVFGDKSTKSEVSSPVPDWTDYGEDSGGEGGVPYFTRFHMPKDLATFPYPPTDRPKNPAPISKAQDVDFRYLDGNIDVNAAMQTFVEAQRKADAAGARQIVRDVGYDGKMRNIAYSFEHGPVHYTLFSAEHDFTEGSAQYEFIKKDLESVDRQRTPWVVIGSHRPMYCSSIGCSLYDGHLQAMDMRLRTSIEPLMVKYKVDVGLWGHVHTYERTCAINNYVCADDDNGAPVNVIIGMAGHIYNRQWAPFAGTVDVKGRVHNSTDLKGNFHHSQPDWSVFRTMNFGFSHFVANGTHFDFKFYGNKRISVHDHFTLIKKY